ncbi:hypothetical protein [Spirillospora sp. NPDC029432]|uniref:hypothetical protein n=1 Tax=Spirillospora sp. NPDC029432 TaxID=3154599 RepID=UPI003452185F
MAGIVRLAVAGAVALVLVKSCGRPAEEVREAAARPPGPAAMARAVLSQQEVAGGFVPAEDGEVFAGLDPDDAQCARLLRLADLREGGLRGAHGAREAHAAFYRQDPPASLAEHVFRLPPGRASRFVARARTALAGCPGIPNGGRVLERSRLERPEGARDAVGATFGDGRGGTALNVVFVRSRNDLLILAAAGAGTAGAPMERLAAGAVGKLEAFQLERARKAVRAAP